MDPKYTRNRYYVGADGAITREWGHRDLAGATDHARRLLQDEGRDEVFIVKIVRVVRTASRPIVVEDFRDEKLIPKGSWR